MTNISIFSKHAADLGSAPTLLLFYYFLFIFAIIYVLLINYFWQTHMKIYVPHPISNLRTSRMFIQYKNITKSPEHKS